jgi:hypothetical protein
MKITGIWDMALCSMGGNCCVHFQSVLTLQMGAAGFSAVSELASRTALRTGGRRLVEASIFSLPPPSSHVRVSVSLSFNEWGYWEFFPGVKWPER